MCCLSAYGARAGLRYTQQVRFRPPSRTSAWATASIGHCAAVASPTASHLESRPPVQSASITRRVANCTARTRHQRALLSPPTALLPGVVLASSVVMSLGNSSQLKLVAGSIPATVRWLRLSRRYTARSYTGEELSSVLSPSTRVVWWNYGVCVCLQRRRRGGLRAVVNSDVTLMFAATVLVCKGVGRCVPLLIASLISVAAVQHSTLQC